MIMASLNETVAIDSFNAPFENLHLYFSHLEISKIEGVDLAAFPPASPYCNIWHDLSVNSLNSYRDLVGKVYIFFRNQGKDQTLALSLDCQVRVKAPGDTMAADSFSKLVQYLFDWIGKWVKDNDIRDQSNTPFVMPAFLYSATHFEQALPQ